MSGPQLSFDCPARAALAGNPSDGYGGAVFAVPVPTLRAVVRRHTSGGHDGAALTITAGQTATTADDLLAGAHAAWTKFAPLVAPSAEALPPLSSLEVSVTTSIPRSVGLAGSSAIVVSALRLFAEALNVTTLRPDELATMAWWAENEHLGIACGLQDRVVQAYGRPVLMDFSPAQRRTVLGFEAGGYQAVDFAGRQPVALGQSSQPAWLRPSLLVASHPTGAAPSGEFHGDLRRKARADAAAVETVMAEIGEQARRAAGAFAVGDVAALANAMDASFALRCEHLEVDTTTQSMASTARDAGAAANTTGSGGSVIALAADAEQRTRARHHLEAMGCSCTTVAL